MSFLNRKEPLRNPTERQILYALMALAVFLRIFAALYLGKEVRIDPGVADQVSYHELAVRVLQGHGFTFGTGWWPATPANQPTAHWSYLYVLFLAALYSIFGVNPLVVRIIQAVLMGVLHPWLIWRISRRIYGSRVGLVAAGITSCYAYFIYYAGALMTESLHILAILWILEASMMLVGSTNLKSYAGGFKYWIGLGIAMALATLLRQVALLLVLLILAWIGWQVINHRTVLNGSTLKTARPLLGRMVLTLLILLACIAPWTIRNYRVFGHFVLLNTNAGFAFFWGNHPIHGSNFIPILPGNGSEYGALIPRELRNLNEAELDKALLRKGISFVMEEPGRYLLLSISRAQEYFRFWPSADSGKLSNYARVFSFGICFPFLLLGLCMTVHSLIRSGKSINQGEKSGEILLLITAGLYTLIHLLTWTLVRYRLPVDAITMPFVALSVVGISERIFNRSRVANSICKTPINKLSERTLRSAK